MKKTFLLLCFILTAKIYSQNILWMRRLDLSQNELVFQVAKDSSENIIIAGSYENIAGDSSDILVLKCNPSGETLWHRRFDMGQTDWTYALITDPMENIIISTLIGQTEIPGLIKLSPNGETLWTRIFPTLPFGWLNGIAVDSSNNIIACASTGNYSAIIKFDTNGYQIWSRRYYNLSGGIPYFVGIVLDTNENIIITGESGTFDTIWLLVAKFNNNGDTIWTRRFARSQSQSSLGTKIVLDNIGNIVVAGFDIDGSNYYDCPLLKYSPAGAMLWNRIINFRPFEVPSGIAIDGFNNIFISGSCGRRYGDSLDYFLVKYSSSGETLWTRFYDAGSDDGSGGVVVDSQNNPIISGSSSNGTDYDILTIKYSGSSGILDSTYAYRTGNNSFNIKFSNPINRLSKILLQIKKSNYYKIVLHNTLGEVVEIIYQGHLAKGEYYFPLSLNRTGCYILRVESENNNVCRKIIFLDQFQHK